MTFAEAGESRAWSCFWVVTAGSSRTRGRWFCMEAPSSDSAYCFGFFLLYIQIFVTELFKRDRLGTVRWGGRRTVPLAAFHVWSSPLPQHRACPGFQRPPAEDNKEAGRRAETQGRRELPELPCWVSPAAVVSLPFFFFCCLFPSSALPSACWATPGSRSWMNRQLGWIQKPSSTCGECHQGHAGPGLDSFGECVRFYVCVMPFNARESHSQGVSPTVGPGALHLCPLPEQLGD